MEKAREEYALVERRYIQALESKGLAFAPEGQDSAECRRLLEKLRNAGVEVRNAGASLSIGHLSKACVECTGNGGSETFSTTFKCHRDCYFCFNKNQADYDFFFENGCPWEEGLARCASENDTLACIGLTGGEPLLNLDDSIRFLEEAAKRFPDAHKRMYTSGDLLTEEGARRLQAAGLDEIRFSVKDDDTQNQQARVLDAMRLAKRYIPSVMVEMPVIPGAKERMQELLCEFDGIGIDGINMLEFCFPFSNWDEFEKRGFKLKRPPFEIMYDYGYSGGLAVAGSERLILELMLWAVEKGLGLGLHYCSLENKHRSEIRQKNERAKGMHPCLTFDEGDFFLKCGKVFGCDIAPAMDVLNSSGCKDFIEDADEDSLAFPLGFIERLGNVSHADGGPLKPQVCYFVYEIDGEGAYFTDVAIRDAF